MPLKGSPIFMVGCSRIELAAITTDFKKPEVRLTYWHMLRALCKEAATKLQYSVEECGMKWLRMEESFEKN